MNRWLWLVVAMLPTVGTASESEVTRLHTFAARSISSLLVKAGVGEVRIEPGSSDAIEVRLTLKAKRTTGWFSALPDLSTLDLSSTTRGEQLTLDVDSKNIEERWVITLPKKTLSALELKLGVGDIDIKATATRVEVDLGVGDASIESATGAIALRLGTGDATIRTTLANAGEIVGKVGVGDVSLEGASGTVTSKMTGGRVSGKGRGTEPLEATIGVGDLKIILVE